MRGFFARERGAIGSGFGVLSDYDASRSGRICMRFRDETRAT